MIFRRRRLWNDGTLGGWFLVPRLENAHSHGVLDGSEESPVESPVSTATGR